MRIEFLITAIAVAFYFFQAILLHTSQRRIVRLLPLITIGAMYLVSAGLIAAEHIFVFGDGCQMYAFFGILLAAAATVALVAVGVAWLVDRV